MSEYNTNYKRERNKINNEELIELYCVQLKSIKEISSIINCYEQLISETLKSLNIPIRSGNSKSYYENRRKSKDVCCVCGHSQHTTEYFNTGKFYCSRHYTQLQHYGKILDRTKFDSNEIIEYEDYAIVILYDIKNIKNGECLIDLEDIALIKQHKWVLDRQGYVVTRTKNKRRLSMHRLLLSPTDEELVDHINLNKSDNRKNNLRIVNKSQNEMNKPVRSDNSSGFKGIYEDKGRNKWIAELCYNGEKVLRKRFDTIEEAIKARKEAEIKYFGEFRYQETNAV